MAKPLPALDLLPLLYEVPLKATPAAKLTTGIYSMIEPTRPSTEIYQLCDVSSAAIGHDMSHDERTSLL
jgi:hypothetical protein